MNEFNTLIVITAPDLERVKMHMERQIKYLPGRDIIYVGSDEVGELLSKLTQSPRVKFFNENDVLPFDAVYNVMSEHMKDILDGQIMPRGVVGWYYQQFLKMQYSKLCEDRFYMTWDGDTVPCDVFSMYDTAEGKPYMDLKHEYHEEYFNTMPYLIPGMKKVIQKSFISEHMLFEKDMMLKLIKTIEDKCEADGAAFWEKIIHSITPERITKSAFSEFETYGTFVALNDPFMYKLRSWHSFRTAGDFFDPEQINDRDYAWLARDFFAVSFEKWSSVREDHRNLFDNPEYQSKLSAKQMLQIAQEEFQDGYIEVWD